MTTEVENGQEATPEKTDSSVTALPIEKKEEGPDEEESEAEEIDSDDDLDDDVNIMIGDIDGEAVININPVQRCKQRRQKDKTPQQAEVLITSSSGKLIPNPEKDALTDKPWQKPGADLSDYFNYGFEETSWRKYSEKQRTLRDRALLLLRTRTNIAQFAPPGMPFLPMGPSPIKSENFNRSNPPPVISSNGSVPVSASMGDRRGPPDIK
ncbi:Oidioi.mRNA.OKI2018_I69.chr1.g3934.t1.cds [Oikopleura dioica]|uniref:Oidioi.mRNA.OKI2018_I69.chr1.g3934.t1.cds n=1 Tax=Oikopleura dioica TaxID=34765 RepID=A0ABN7SXE6_OIKDI|nr:Oidioi.mRNA.OKI2018_I69.chr1.g3934.t1.cds [Oikopleura dioica]